MPNKFKKINELKDSFEFNLDDVSSSKFETTRSLFHDFSSAFNVKALAIAMLMGLSVEVAAAEQTPLTAIQETFNQSIRMVNSNYHENLPTYFENKNSIKDDIILKNEFWKGSVSTLIIGDFNTNVADMNYREQVSIMDQTKGNALYISEFANNFLSPKKLPTVDEYYNNTSEYKHYFRNDSSSILLNEMKARLKLENQIYFEDFITYHEMAHGSFEQENSRLNNKAVLGMHSELQLESHSDVSSLFMIANKYALDYKQFKSLTNDILQIRSLYAGAGRDFNHNTSLVLSELLYTLDRNENVYKNMSTDKISAFSSYFVHEVCNQDTNKLFKKLESENIPTSINEFLIGLEEFRTALKKVQSENGYILESPKMGGGPFYMYMVENVYFSRNPEKYIAYNEAVSGGFITQAAGIKMKAIQDVINQSDDEKSIYAVEAHKLMKKMSVENYINYLSSYYNPADVPKVHNQAVLADVFKINKDEINKEISADIIIKNKI